MSSTEFAANRDNFCYRHPDRQSFVLCQRCMRTICPECQTQAPVGVICPECMQKQRKAESPAQRKARRSWGGRSLAVANTGKPVVTYAIIAVTVFVGLLQLIPGIDVTKQLLFAAPYLYPQYLYPEFSLYPFEPWRLITAMFVHGGVWHLGLNMLALWMLGRSLEPMLGRSRFLTLYLLGGLAGSAAVAALAPLTATVGASGGVFALLGALLVIGRHIGANVSGILVILGINLVIGFIPGFNIAWQAHIGGALGGALIALIYARTRLPKQRIWQIVLLVTLTAVLLSVAWFVPPLVLFG